MSADDALLARFPRARPLWKISMPHTPKLGRPHPQHRGFTLTGYLVSGRVVILQQFHDGGWLIFEHSPDFLHPDRYQQ